MLNKEVQVHALCKFVAGSYGINVLAHVQATVWHMSISMHRCSHMNVGQSVLASDDGYELVWVAAGHE